MYGIINYEVFLLTGILLNLIQVQTPCTLWGEVFHKVEKQVCILFWYYYWFFSSYVVGCFWFIYYTYKIHCAI